MATFNITKVVSSLPGTLTANTMYVVRVGTGFDLYTTNNSGTIVAYKFNAIASQGANSTALDGLTGAADTLAYFTAAATMATAPFTSFGRSIAAAADAATAKTALTLNNVDNTSDANKPVSTATQTALGGKLDVAGVAASATKLATARTINGVSFDGTANITVTAVDATKLPLDGTGVMTGPINEAPIQSATAAATVNLTNSTANTVSMSGSTTISAFSSAASGVTRRVIFTAAVTLTHSSTFYLPGAANITAAINDIAEFVSLGSGTWKCYNFMKANGQPTKGALVAFVDALVTTGISATVNTSQFSSTATSTDADIVLQPKGNGGLSAWLADSAATGGNKRGVKAVDWQQLRTTAAQVASGANSVIGGGSGNQVQGSYAVVAGGSSNVASTTNATIAGGVGNVASGQYSFVGGGGGNTVSNNYSACIGGQSNTISGAGSTCLGGTQGKDFGMTQVMVRSSGAFATAGDSQYRSAVIKAQLSGTGATSLTVDNTTLSAINHFVPTSNCSIAFTATVVARDSTGLTAAWNVSGAAKKGTTAASMALVGTPTITMVGNDSSASTWTCTVLATTASGYGGLTLNVALVGTGGTGWATALMTCVETVG